MVCSANHDKRYGNGAIRCRYTGGTYQGILRSLTLPLNDVQEGECSAGYIDTVDARESRPLPSSSRSGDPPRRGKAVQHRGRGDPKSPSFRGRSPWNPLWRAEQYVVVSLQQPTGGLRRRKVRGTPLPPCGESYVRSLAPPSRPKSRRYAAVGLETRLRAQFSAAIRYAGFAAETGEVDSTAFGL